MKEYSVHTARFYIVNYSKIIVASIFLFLAQGSVLTYAGLSRHSLHLAKNQLPYLFWVPVYPNIQDYGANFKYHPIRTTLGLPVTVPFRILGEAVMLPPRLLHLPWTPKTIKKHRKVVRGYAPVLWAYHQSLGSMRNVIDDGHSVKVQVPTWEGNGTHTVSLRGSLDIVKKYKKMLRDLDMLVSRRTQSKTIAAIKKELSGDVSDIALALALLQIDEESSFLGNDHKVLSREALIEKLRHMLPEISSIAPNDADLASQGLKNFIIDEIESGHKFEAGMKKIEKAVKHLLDSSESEAESCLEPAVQVKSDLSLSSSSSSSSSSDSDSEADIEPDADQEMDAGVQEPVHEVAQDGQVEQLSPEEALAKAQIEAI
jgi:hypothetical protein